MENEALSLFLAEGADFRGVKRVSNWRVGRAVEGGSLENYCGCELTGGSNPSLSASLVKPRLSNGAFLFLDAKLTGGVLRCATERLRLASPASRTIDRKQGSTRALFAFKGGNTVRVSSAALRNGFALRVPPGMRQLELPGGDN